MNQQQLLREFLGELDNLEDSPVRQIITADCGHLVAVESVGMGIASWALHRPVPAEELPLPGSCDSAKTLATKILEEDPMAATIGLACLNSLLPRPPDENLQDIKAQELIRRYGRGKKVAVIGHFPFVDKIRTEFDQFWVLEKSPKPGDLHADHASRVLPAADVVAVTATTLANGTLAAILQLCSDSAVKIMLGPSTPLSPFLFRCGIHALAGCLVTNRTLAGEGILAGLPFKQLKGVRYVVWEG